MVQRGTTTVNIDSFACALRELGGTTWHDDSEYRFICMCIELYGLSAANAAGTRTNTAALAALEAFGHLCFSPTTSTSRDMPLTADVRVTSVLSAHIGYLLRTFAFSSSTFLFSTSTFA